MVDFGDLVHSMNLDHYLLLVAGLVALIPFAKLVKLYLDTNIREYLLFASVFLLSTIFTQSIIIAEVTNDLIYWQISYTARNTTYFIFFMHTIRMVWMHPPWFVSYPGVVLYFIVEVFIILWQPKSNDQGAEFVAANGIEVYSTSFRLIGNIFQLYVAILFLYGYYIIKLTKPSTKLKLAHSSMLIVGGLLLGSRTIRVLQNFWLPKLEIIEMLGDLVLLSGFAMVAILFWYYPQSIMLSRVEIGGILIISEQGTPIGNLKFEGSRISGSPTLIAGIISAVESTVGTIASDVVQLREVDATNRSILVHKRNQILFIIVTNTSPTTVVRSSLKFFSKKFIELKSDQISEFNRSGRTIEDISDITQLAFPHTSGLEITSWEGNTN